MDWNARGGSNQQAQPFIYRGAITGELHLSRAKSTLLSAVKMLLKNLMVQRLRQLLLVLIALAFTGGASVQLARSAAYATPTVITGVPCDMMMSHAGTHDEAPILPCKDMTSDCIKQMGCVTDAALPARTMDLDIAAAFSVVDYWSARSTLADFVREPEPLPPRTV